MHICSRCWDRQVTSHASPCNNKAVLQAEDGLYKMARWILMTSTESPSAVFVTETLSVQVMDQYDKNHQGQIDFGDFLRMFRHKLLDLQDLMKYMSMKSAREREQQQQQQQAAAPSTVRSRSKADAHVVLFSLILACAKSWLTLTRELFEHSGGAIHRLMTGQGPTLNPIKDHGNTSRSQPCQAQHPRDLL